MARVYLEEGEQARFLQAVKDKTGLTWRQIATICQVERHTLQTWRKEACRMSYRALVRLSRLSGVPTPPILEIVSEAERKRRANVKGGKARVAIHGPPGTPEGRSKGGRVLQQRRREHPELYTRAVTRKTIHIPLKCEQLAELVGILLGDGGIAKSGLQVAVSFHAQEELPYTRFVASLMMELFGLTSSLKMRNENLCEVVVSSVALVEFLESIGLQRGNKVRHQVGVPEWIFSTESYVKACLRGLIDTDGSVYPETKVHKGREYRYVNISFFSASAPLCKGVKRMLKMLGFSPTSPGKSIYLRRQAEVHRYFKVVGTHNNQRWERYQTFCRWQEEGRAMREGS